MKEKFVARLKEKYENVDNITFNGYNMNFLCASPRLSETFIVTGELIEKIQKAIENSIIANWNWSYMIGMFSAGGSSYRNRLFYTIILENIDDVDINIYLCDKREIEVLQQEKESNVEFSIVGLLLLGTK